MILLPNQFSPPRAPSSSPLPPNPRISRLRYHGFRCLCRAEWGTNAESVRRGRFGQSSDVKRGVEGEEAGEGFGREEKRRWWSDNNDYDSDDDDDDDDFDFDFVGEDESFWDKIWIFKVLKSYGYVLPVIIISTLLSTGPKAFLMALAIPLGQSAISIAIDSIWGKKARDGFKPRSKTRRRPFRRGDNNDKSNGYNRRKASYQSWVSSNQGGVYDESKKSGLGGWDELDRESEERAKGSGNGETVTKLSKRGRRYNEVPMFMRLLVAVFPFLGSWFRIL